MVIGTSRYGKQETENQTLETQKHAEKPQKFEIQHLLIHCACRCVASCFINVTCLFSVLAECLRVVQELRIQHKLRDSERSE